MNPKLYGQMAAHVDMTVERLSLLEAGGPLHPILERHLEWSKALLEDINKEREAWQRDIDKILSGPDPSKGVGT